ncbi:MAG: hypothetical protein ACXACW_09765, partial [Candidatus Hodarchaeales archaeon]
MKKERSIFTKQKVSETPLESDHMNLSKFQKDSRGDSVRDSQIKLSRLISRRTMIIGVGSFTTALLIIIILSLGEDRLGIDRISVGLILLTFLSTVLSLVIDILRGRNFAEWSALGAIISYFGIFLIFIPLLVYVIFPAGITDVLVNVTEIFGIVLLVIGVT